MKREDITRTDFPTARKGYDQAAVDAHLREVADAYSELGKRVGSASLAEIAAEKVSSIVEAAEAKAREIEADAKREADELLSQARAQSREQIERAQSSVAKLVGQADELRERVGAMAREVGAGAGPGAETEPGPEVVPEPAPPEPEVDPTPVTVPEPTPTPIPEPEPPLTPEPEPPLPAASNGADEQAARLVAMKMALDGSSREEVERHLAQSYELGDTGKLLDDVFARAGR
jgi:DivIVA domain-containing protein